MRKDVITHIPSVNYSTTTFICSFQHLPKALAFTHELKNVAGHCCVDKWAFLIAFSHLSSTEI